MMRKLHKPHPNPSPEGEGLIRFAASAGRLAALAAQVLGWRPGEFWAATPAELALSLGSPKPDQAPPSRSELTTMMERDRDGRTI